MAQGGFLQFRLLWQSVILCRLDTLPPKNLSTTTSVWSKTTPPFTLFLALIDSHNRVYERRVFLSLGIAIDFKESISLTLSK